MFIKKISTINPQDPISTLLLPLKGESKDIPKNEGYLEILNSREHHKPILSVFYEVSENLCSHEVENNHLRTLRRIIHFVCLTPYFHIQALASNGNLSNRPPLVLTTDINNDSSISLLSKESIEIICSLN